MAAGRSGGRRAQARRARVSPPLHAMMRANSPASPAPLSHAGAADDPIIAGVNDSTVAALPFVLLDFDLRTDTASVLASR